MSGSNYGHFDVTSRMHPILLAIALAAPQVDPRTDHEVVLNKSGTVDAVWHETTTGNVIWQRNGGVPCGAGFAIGLGRPTHVDNDDDTLFGGHPSCVVGWLANAPQPGPYHITVNGGPAVPLPVVFAGELNLQCTSHLKVAMSRYGGKIVAAWMTNTAMGQRVAFQRFAITAAMPGLPIALAPTAFASTEVPYSTLRVSSVSAADNGDFVIAYERFGGNAGNGVFVRAFHADGTPKFGELTIAAHDARYTYSDAAMYADGSFVVVYRSQSNFYGEVRDANGTQVPGSGWNTTGCVPRPTQSCCGVLRDLIGNTGAASYTFSIAARRSEPGRYIVAYQTGSNAEFGIDVCYWHFPTNPCAVVPLTCAGMRPNQDTFTTPRTGYAENGYLIWHDCSQFRAPNTSRSFKKVWMFGAVGGVPGCVEAIAPCRSGYGYPYGR